MILRRRKVSLWAVFLTIWLIVNWYVMFSLRSSSNTPSPTGGLDSISCANELRSRNATGGDEVARNKLTHSYQRGAVNLCPPEETFSSDYVNMIGTFPKDKRYLTIAMSSVSRPGKSYIFQTLTTIIRKLSLKDRGKVHIVVFLADLKQSLKSKLKRAIEGELASYLSDGILHVIQAPYEFYPSFTELKPKYGDSPSRTKWRSKQNIDFSYLMCYCSGLSEYYLHLEDDILPAPSFFPKLQDFISMQLQPWYVLSTAVYGHIGKVFHSKDLKSLSSFYYIFYDEMPCDWLLLFWRRIKEPFAYTSLNSPFILSPGSLFQHFGSQSSLKEKTQNLTEPYFDAFNHKFKGLNPPASLTSNIVGHQGRPEDAYNKGIGYFWGKKINKDDYIQIHFNSPVQLKRIVINTGSNFAPRDILVKGALEVSYENSNDKSYKQEAYCSNFLHISNFEIMLDLGLTSRRSINCLRFRVREEQPAWLFVREVNIWTW